MPIFDYKCLTCNNVAENIFVHRYDDTIMCAGCKCPMLKLVPTGVNIDCFPAEGIHLKHVCAGGKTFHSKSEMKRYAKQHDVELGALL